MHRLKQGVKINGTYYRYVVLRQKMLLPDIRSASGRVVLFLAGQFSFAPKIQLHC